MRWHRENTENQKPADESNSLAETLTTAERNKTSRVASHDIDGPRENYYARQRYHSTSARELLHTSRHKPTMTENTVNIPDFKGTAPVNYRDFRESIALALASENVDESTIHAALLTVDDAVVANEEQLTWPTETPIDQ